jgi:hypothetical protein
LRELSGRKSKEKWIRKEEVNFRRRGQVEERLASSDSLDDFPPEPKVTGKRDKPRDFDEYLGTVDYIYCFLPCMVDYLDLEGFGLSANLVYSPLCSL